MAVRNDCYPFVGEHNLCCLCKPKETKNETDIRAFELQPMARDSGQVQAPQADGERKKAD